MRTLDRKLLREFRQLRGQVIAIALVVIGGVSTMAMALSNYQALAQTRSLYYSEYRFADVFAGLKRAPESVARELQNLDGVRDVQSRVMGFASLELAGYEEAVTGQFVSLSRPTDPGLNRLFLREGRRPLADHEVVIGEPFARAHGLGPGDVVTAVLNGRRQRLEICGIGLSPEFVYQIRPGDVFPDFERFGVVWMQAVPLANAFDLQGAFNDLALTLTREATEATVIAAIDRTLEPYGGIGAYGRDLQLSHRFLDEEMKQLQTMTRLFSVIFLGVTAFLLNVVVGRLVSTQREQIAVLKAFGYSRFEVSLHYAKLVLMVVGVGVLPGLAVGFWLGRLMASVYMTYYSFPYLVWTLQPSVVALGIGFAFAAAALGTSGALRRVFALSPAAAMQPEAPAVFRRTLTERLGLTGLLDAPSRMTLRNLERQPRRTALAVLGIGLAVGILVMSRFQVDAIDTIVEVQFGFAQRDDLTVGFVEPVSLQAAGELAALPGVFVVEPFRNAGVRLRNGHRSYRTALQGLPSRSTLRRVLDTGLRPIPVPADGLLLTDYLAQILGVGGGDLIEVEFLQGHRRSVMVMVAGTVQEYLGVGAYASRGTVNRLLGEGGVITGAWLGFAEEDRGAVIDALRERPRVASVTDRAAMVHGFRETMAEGIATFALFITLMAGSIAVGVVYNSARIILAERGRELASLRVLGYTRGETRRILLGELYLLCLLALLPGFLIGCGLAAVIVAGLESDLYRIPMSFTPPGFGFAGLTVLLATALSGALVRRRLDRLDLIAVLKARE